MIDMIYLIPTDMLQEILAGYKRSLKIYHKLTDEKQDRDEMKEYEKSINQITKELRQRK
jgi:hypothetical protein